MDWRLISSVFYRCPHESIINLFDFTCRTGCGCGLYIEFQTNNINSSLITVNRKKKLINEKYTHQCSIQETIINHGDFEKKNCFQYIRVYRHLCIITRFTVKFRFADRPTKGRTRRFN